MISVAPGEIVFRGQSANRYIGMDSDGNLFTHVSNSRNIVTVNSTDLCCVIKQAYFKIKEPLVVQYCLVSRNGVLFRINFAKTSHLSLR